MSGRTIISLAASVVVVGAFVAANPTDALARSVHVQHSDAYRTAVNAQASYAYAYAGAAYYGRGYHPGDNAMDRYPP